MRFSKSKIILGIILLLGGLVRLQGFASRYTLSSDSARDVLVAQGALLAGQLPWVGSFSSAGPFVFGPNWYWWLMFWKLVSGWFLAPWFGMLLVSLTYILVMYLVGKITLGKRFGLILALITAVSSQVIALSAYLTQHALVEIFSGLALLGLVAYIRYRRLLFAFLMAFSISAALSLHYQAINSLVYFPILFLLDKPKLGCWFKLSIVLFLGFVIPLFPLMLWDSTRGFRNLEQLIYYFRVGQYRFWVSNRWLTYAGVFWPEYLGKFLGDKAVALAVVCLGGAVGIWRLWRRAIPQTIIWPMVILAVQFVLLRYFRGEKYDGYLVYLHSLLILAIGWVLWELTKLNKWAGWAVIMAVIFTSMRLNVSILDWNNGGGRLLQMIEKISWKYPDHKFTVFVKGLASSNCAYSFSALVEGANKGSAWGIPVGICQSGPADCGQAGAVPVGQTTFQGETCTLVDLQAVPESKLIKTNDWYNFSASAVYDDVQNWWRK